MIHSQQVTYCSRCIMPSTRPRIVFDDEGVCNACRHAEQKRSIDWESRKEEFLRLVARYRSKTGAWDCIVPWSGGKDSSSIAYRLKFDFGLNPLLATFSPLIVNEVGQANRESLLRVGFDTVFFRPNQSVARRLSRRFFIERGNLKVAWDAGINAVPIQTAVNYGIPLVFYAEHGESEYGGKVLSEESQKIRDFTEVLEHQIGDDPRNWVDEEISLRDLAAYTYPDLGEVRRVGVTALYFGYFFCWSMLENYRFISSRMPFCTAAGGRTTGTFTNFDSLDDKTDDLYYYLQYVKFGFGRAVRDACRMVQNGQMTREEAVELAHKYDGEFPERNIDEVLDYLQLRDIDELNTIIDTHRNPEIWQKDGGMWKLRFPVR